MILDDKIALKQEMEGKIKNKYRKDLLMTFSHELKTPINGKLIHK